MNGRNAKGLMMATCLLMIAGCGSSPEDRLYEAFKCGKVATLLEQEKDGAMALANAIPYMKQMEADGENPARVAMEMNQRFQDDVPLHRLAIGGQMAMLSDIYQSDECQELYKPINGLTQVGDINLAGCEVPPGSSPEQAEKIECAKVDPYAASSVPMVEQPEAVAEDSAATMAVAAAANAVAAANEATDPAASSDAEVIKAAISTRAAQDEGSEYADARRSVEGDLNGDGTPNVAVLYSLEGAGGGNGSVGYLAAFVRASGQLKLVDTVTLSGSAQALELKGGAAHLKLLSLAPDDSACCPSVEDDAMYILDGSKWLQVQTQP